MPIDPTLLDDIIQRVSKHVLSEMKERIAAADAGRRITAATLPMRVLTYNAKSNAHKHRAHTRLLMLRLCAALATRANELGCATVSHQELALDSGVSDQTIKKYIPHLEQMGVLQVISEGLGDEGNGKCYRLFWLGPEEDAS